MPALNPPTPSTRLGAAARRTSRRSTPPVHCAMRRTTPASVSPLVRARHGAHAGLHVLIATERQARGMKVDGVVRAIAAEDRAQAHRRRGPCVTRHRNAETPPRHPPRQFARPSSRKLVPQVRNFPAGATVGSSTSATARNGYCAWWSPERTSSVPSGSVPIPMAIGDFPALLRRLLSAG